MGGVADENNFLILLSEALSRILIFSGVAAPAPSRTVALTEGQRNSVTTAFWGLVSKVSMEVKDELMDIVEKVWDKLQALPQASPLELGAFSVLILFFGE